MDDDQQFCLRWNNHQSTLISVFDTLLENETLVDCTLAAEGKFLKAHKVVLSACSPYFATLLQEQYDKHPIFILKDVKYQELRAMMDYMYRGEVNISQDQLAALLKAAESLQIKGLSDNRTSAGNSGNTIPKIDTSSHQAQQQQQQHRNLNVPLVGKISGGYTLEQTKRQRLGPSTLDAATELSGSREGSSSPSRRRRKVRRRSIENTVMSDVHHDNSNSSQQQTNSIVGAPTSGLSGVSAITAAASALAAAQLPAGALAAAAAVAAAAAATGSSSSNVVAGSNLTANVSATSANVTKKTEGNIKSVSGVTTAPNASSNNNNNDAMTTENLTAAGGSTIMSTDDQEHQHHLNKADKQPQQPQQHHNNNNKQQHKIGAKDTSDLVVEPKSEYDDEGNEETVEDLTLDDEDMGMDDLDHNAGTSQGGAEGSNQGYVPWQHDRSQDELLLATQEAQQRDPQGIMGKYDFEASLVLGKGEVNTSGERFPCAVCGKSYLRKRHLQRHMRDECIGIPPRFSCELCPSRFRRKYHMVRHLTSKHSIPPAIAQQATGGGTRTSMASTSATNSATNMTNNNINYNGAINNLSMLKSHDSSAYESDSGGCMGVENLSLRRDAFENNNGVGHKNSGGSHVSAASPAHSGGACSSSGTHSPLPTAHIPITYGLSGAITAITSAYSGAPSETVHDAMTIGAATTENSTNIKSIKSEPMSPDSKSTTTDTAALAAAAAATVDDVVGKMDDDWKMKLSLQLISNSLLKERLMNTIPFGSGYNNSN